MDESGEPGRHWTHHEVAALYALPFPELMFRAQCTHRAHFDPNEIQASQLLSVRTGACPEDCAYCPQSAHHDTGLQAEKLMAVEAVVEAAGRAKQGGATRFCMGGAWRAPKDRDVDRLCEMVTAVRALGMETCVTAGMLSERHVDRLNAAGLDYYNHNLDSSASFYKKIITTRRYQDRLDTLQRVRNAGIKVCCGGIIGMGESRDDRIELLTTLANLEPPPESVPINRLVPVPGTPLENAAPIDPLEFVCTIAVARILMPASRVRLSAGRESMSDEMQALCFVAGANSIFCGDTLLTTPNPASDADADLLRRLGMHTEASDAHAPA